MSLLQDRNKSVGEMIQWQRVFVANVWSPKFESTARS